MDRIYNPPVPEDWREIAPTMHKRDLSLRYEVRCGTITRWVKESGVQAKRRERVWFPKAEKDERIALESVPECDAAADFLRGFYSNVHRCDIQMTLSRTWGQVHDIPDKGRGRYYVEGVGVVTNEGLMQLARKHGHDAPVHRLPPNWKD
jgi:hypothetical protein